MTGADATDGHVRTGARFLGVGAINTVVGLLVIWLAKWLFGIGDVPANAMGYAIGLLLSFALNRRWTFRHRGAALPAFLRFVFVTALAYGLNLLTVLVLIHLGVNSYVAQALGIGPYTLASYLASRYFVFRAGA